MSSYLGTNDTLHQRLKFRINKKAERELHHRVFEYSYKARAPLLETRRGVFQVFKKCGNAGSSARNSSNYAHRNIILICNKVGEHYITNDTLPSSYLKKNKYNEVHDFNYSTSLGWYLVILNHRAPIASLSYVPVEVKATRKTIKSNFPNQDLRDSNMKKNSILNAWDLAMIHDWSFLDRSTKKSA